MRNMLLAWQSRKLKRVVKSALTAETLALQEAIKAGIMIKTIFLEMLNVYAHNQILPIKCVTDRSHFMMQCILLRL